VQVDVAEQAAQHRAADESEAEGGADLAEAFGPVFGR
jgi:hypothetical protein